MEIKKTSLHKLHNDHQAKFVEFAGYEMPIQYKKGIIEEHKFTRSNSGIFDVSHTVSYTHLTLPTRLSV